MYEVTSLEPRDHALSYPVVSVQDGGKDEWWEPEQPRITLRGLLDAPVPHQALGVGTSPVPGWTHLTDDVRATVDGGDGFSPLAWPTTDIGEVELVLARLDVEAGGQGGAALVQEIVGAEPVPVLVWEADGGGSGAVSPSYEGFIAALPEGTSDVEVRYAPERPGEQQLTFGALSRVRRTAHEPFDEFRELLLWRAYLGDDSWSVDGISDRAWGALRHTIRLPLVRGRRFIVGRIVHVGLRCADDALTDPTHEKRLKLLRKDHHDVVTACPELESTPQEESGELIVVVHGTMSCAIPIAGRLREWLPHATIRRFEHDTFRPVTENAEQLATCIRSRPGISRIWLLGHSRGGLVARHAAAKLEGDTSTSRDVRTITFGTPFKGSPLVDVAWQHGILIAAFAWLGAQIATDTGVPLMDRLTRTVSLLHKLPRLPDGIADMRPGNSYLGLLSLTSTDTLLTFAGNYPDDLRLAGYAFLRDAQPAFRGANNDLVVSVDSATVGKGHTVDVCHFKFFDDDRVADLVRAQTGDFISAKSRRKIPVKGPLQL